MMKSFVLRSVVCSVCLCLFTLGCGDDVVEGQLGDDEQNQAANGNSDQNQSNDGNAESPEDCVDGEIYNPTTGQCVEVGNDGESEGSDDNGDEIDLNDPDPDCEDGEVIDPVTGECVEEGEELECGPGNLIGTTCRPNGGALPNATVRLLGVGCDGTVVNELTTADGQGDYEFYDIPTGSYELEITSGSFSAIEEVDIYAGETTNLKSENAKICIEPEGVDIAVIRGSFDNIRELLGGMNIDYDEISGSTEIAQFFGDMDALREYDIIFAECGSTWPSNPFDVDVEDIKTNLRRFVEEGNSLYASDWAHQYVQEVFPEAVDWYADGTSTRVGNSETVMADVVSTEMQALLDSTTTEINFNLGSWAVALGAGPSSQVQFRSDVNGGSIEDAALMIIYHDLVGNGRVIYTSFHNSAQLVGDMQEILEFMIFQL